MIPSSLTSTFRGATARNLCQRTTCLSSSSRALKFIISRRLATEVLASEGPAVTATNRAEMAMKRFWKKVDVDHRPDGIAVTLDKRPLKTPSGNVLIIPPSKSLLAALIALEWETQSKVLKTHTLPMTSLASRAIDGLSDQQTLADVRTALLKYLDTDTVCFHEEEPEALVVQQETHWKPLLDWIRNEYNVEVHVFNSLLGSGQPEQTKKTFEKVLTDFDSWQMAALERATYTTKSFLIALALVRGRLSVEQAALAANVEVNSQIERWGEVEDSHDVDYHDVRRQLGSVACLIAEGRT